jgi:hypothetical protein
MALFSEKEVEILVDHILAKALVYAEKQSSGFERLSGLLEVVVKEHRAAASLLAQRMQYLEKQIATAYPDAEHAGGPGLKRMDPNYYVLRGTLEGMQYAGSLLVGAANSCQNYIDEVRENGPVH